LGLANSVVEVLIDEGTACFTKGTREFRGAEFEEQNENDKIGQAEDENGADLAEDGGEEFVVEEVADIATGHFSSGGGGAFETAGTGEEGVS